MRQVPLAAGMASSSWGADGKEEGRWWEEDQGRRVPRLSAGDEWGGAGAGGPERGRGLTPDDVINIQKRLLQAFPYFNAFRSSWQILGLP